MAHYYIHEQVYHFRCSSCGAWWSLCNLEEYLVRKVTCTHCGATDFIKEAEDD